MVWFDTTVPHLATTTTTIIIIIIIIIIINNNNKNITTFFPLLRPSLASSPTSADVRPVVWFDMTETLPNGFRDAGRSGEVLVVDPTTDAALR
jgi:hypothetical protein